MRPEIPSEPGALFTFIHLKRSNAQGSETVLVWKAHGRSYVSQSGHMWKYLLSNTFSSLHTFWKKWENCMFAFVVFKKKSVDVYLTYNLSVKLYMLLQHTLILFLACHVAQQWHTSKASFLNNQNHCGDNVAIVISSSLWTGIQIMSLLQLAQPFRH